MVAWFLLLVIFAAILLLAPAIVHGLVWWVKRSGADKRSPLTRDLLRGPGESLRPQIEDLTLDLFGWALFLIVLPLLMYSIWITEVHFMHVEMSSAVTAGLAVITLVAFTTIIVHLHRLLRRRRELSLGLDGEIAIGQALDRLASNGCRVFHDVPGDRFNIDHVVVAAGGVYAVETKTRPKPVTPGKTAEVVLDGSVLRFPNWEDTAFLDQALSQAAWLSRWLASAVGERVEVKPVLAIPGWYIKRAQRGPVDVITGADAVRMLSRTDSLSKPMIERIAHQLDQRCRTIEPRAYGRSNGSRSNVATAR